MGTTALLLRTALAPALWGTTYLVSATLLPQGHPLWAAALRALPAGLLLIALRPGLPRGSWWWRSLLLGTLNIGAFFALLFVAAERLPGGVAAILGSVQTLLVVVLAAALLGERARAGQVVSALVGTAGVALLVLRSSASLDPVGVAAGIGTALTMAFGVVLTRRWGLPSGVHSLTAAAWQLLGGSLVLVVLAVGVEGAPPALDGRALAGFAWLSVLGGAFAYAVFFAGLRRLPATVTSLLALVNPLVATLLGWAVLGQALTAAQVVGAALVLGAVLVGQRAATQAPQPGRQRHAASPRPGDEQVDPDEVVVGGVVQPGQRVSV
ncbi:putative blue pigment (indigoidine) exporter [Streptoalloteichus tenebrarius]|uniref:Blue pigment (Indigoidine) exporter n=1 Tax=Streptoalloteichus tenebrarius (strain ATCC 17920 / DSM 40477 / JCM 4838 / CBS 697.72 / NBRC 16177 / NCIMB 11028 / NRRL B-12390 / A12253. 1 / ISP 5477) TaxID=1933 RepID=A0ABT1HRF0_STRSD|nr:EamA family transporter [Streptoalloteichus tenebrarius]MCP2258094.1 putative blue pigment (indigoidine) exporter [Streptoalloteichus tenebrarius]BFF01768.1 EamA family transporter [Streptoalloteichus tenebrarius]